MFLGSDHLMGGVVSSCFSEADADATDASVLVSASLLGSLSAFSDVFGLGSIT